MCVVEDDWPGQLDGQGKCCILVRYWILWKEGIHLRRKGKFHWRDSEFAGPVQHLNETSGRMLALETSHSSRRLGSFQ